MKKDNLQIAQKLKEAIKRKNKVIKRLRVQLSRKKLQIATIKDKLVELKKENMLNADQHKICVDSYDRIPGNFKYIQSSA